MTWTRANSRVIFAAIMLLMMPVALLKSPPVLYSYLESGDPAGDPLWTLFNPLRDKGPESSALLFLNSLRTGSCETAARGLDQSSDHKAYICRQESKYPITDVDLVDRRESTNGACSLYYRVSRVGITWKSPVRVTVSRDLRITAFEAQY